MNKRLDDLAKKAGWSGFEALDERHTKFAELIIKDCLHIVDDEGAGEGGCIRAIIRIQEQYGVNI